YQSPEPARSAHQRCSDPAVSQRQREPAQQAFEHRHPWWKTRPGEGADREAIKPLEADQLPENVGVSVTVLRSAALNDVRPSIADFSTSGIAVLEFSSAF